MRIARGLVVEDVGDGGVRVASCDWPWAAWTAAAALAPGVTLVAWSVPTRHWIELGGGAVFCAFGAACLVLARSRRRDLSISADRNGLSIEGTRGAAPFQDAVAQDLAGGARLEIRPFPAPAGAPDLPDRGGDLTLVAGTAQVLLARRCGPDWRQTLEAARAHVVARIPQLA